MGFITRVCCFFSPRPWHADRRTITRVQCLELNAMAAELCGPGAALCDYAGLVPPSIGRLLPR